MNGTDLQACLSFDNSNGEPVIAKVGLSIVSEKNARENLETEVIGFDFEPCVVLPVPLGNKLSLLLR